MHKLLVIFFLLLTTLFWAQNSKASFENKTISHTVRANETILSISKQYGVDPSLLYRYNRFALDKLEEGMILTFPAPKTTTSSTEKVVVSSETKTTNPVITVSTNTEVKKEVPKKTAGSEISRNVKMHKVQSGETLYGLSKKYDVTIDELKASNPRVAKVGLQIGQELEIPLRGTIIESNNSYTSGETIQHIVQPKETLYGLSKKYGVSVESIQNQNKAVLANGLQANQTIFITIN